MLPSHIALYMQYQNLGTDILNSWLKMLIQILSHQKVMCIVAAVPKYQMIYLLLHILSGKQYFKRSSLSLSDKSRERQRNNPKSLLWCFIFL